MRLGIIGSILSYLLADQVENRLKDAVSPLAPYLRRLGVGFVCILISSTTAALTLILWILALLFSASDYPALASTTLWISLGTLALSILLVWNGFRLVRTPRRR